MTTITAKFLVASLDKKNTLPAAADPNHAMNQPPQATAPELLRIPPYLYRCQPGTYPG